MSSHVEELPELSVQLVVTGEFNPSELTLVAGLAPTRTWRRGDPFGRARRSRKDDGWVCGIDGVRTVDLPELVRRLLGVLANCKTSIRGFANEHNLYLAIRCGIVVTDQQPNTFFSSEIVTEVAAMGAALDIDFYDLVEA